MAVVCCLAAGWEGLDLLFGAHLVVRLVATGTEREIVMHLPDPDGQKTATVSQGIQIRYRSGVVVGAIAGVDVDVVVVVGVWVDWGGPISSIHTFREHGPLSGSMSFKSGGG